MGGLDSTPDLDNTSDHTVWQVTSSTLHTPFTVPEDGWIIDATDHPSTYGSALWTVNGLSAFATGLKFVGSATTANFNGVQLRTKFVPYPVKKGDIIDTASVYNSLVKCTFAPCRGNSAKTN